MTATYPELLWIVIASGISCSFLAISIGSNDVANAFSTSVASGALTLKGAIIIAFIFEIIGSVSLGGRVSDAIRTRVVNFSSFSDAPYELALGMLCSSMGSTVWLVFSTYIGFPVSTTHSIIGALAGFGVASGRLNGIRWVHLLYIIISWFMVPFISIVVCGTIYLVIQEFILRSVNSFQIMMKYHWTMLLIFSIPLSTFIAFENPLLRSLTGKYPDLYREWFEKSNLNKFLSVLTLVLIITVLSSIVTYTISYHRIKAKWSFVESLKNIDPIFTRKTLNPEEQDNVEYIKEENINAEETTKKQEQPKNDPIPLYKEMINEETQKELTENGNTEESEFQITIDQTLSTEINASEDAVEMSQMAKKTFSSSIIDALLTSVGFPQTPKCSISPTYLSFSSSPGFTIRESERDDQHSDRQKSKFIKLVSSFKASYGRPSGKASKHRNPFFPGTYSKGQQQSNKNPPDKMRSSEEKFIKMSPEAKETLNKTQTVFSAMQILASIMSVISHSANDTANAVSTFTTVYFLYYEGMQQNSKPTPWYILISGGFFMSMGLALFGYKVIKTVGMNITKVTPSRGYTIDSTTGGIVLVLSHLGIPLSSTHVTVSSILGIGLISQLPVKEKKKPEKDKEVQIEGQDNQGVYSEVDILAKHLRKENKKQNKIKQFFQMTLTTKHVNLKLYRKIFFTWIVTIFSSGVLTAIIFLFSKLIYKVTRKK